MAVDDEKDRPLGSDQQALQKALEHRRRDRAFVAHETEITPGADRRDHVQRETSPGGGDDRRLPRIA